MSSRPSASPPAPRAGARRPALSKGDRQEALLLDSVEKLLASRPLAKVTLAEIAAHAGLSRPAVYFYFDSKLALVEAAITRIFGGLLKEFDDRATAPDESLATSIDRFLESCTVMWRRSGALLGAGVELMGQRPTLRAAWEGCMARSAESLATVIERERARGTLPDTGEVGPMALAVSWMCERNYYMLYTREHTPDEEVALHTTLSTVILNGIGAGSDVLADRASGTGAVVGAGDP